MRIATSVLSAVAAVGISSSPQGAESFAPSSSSLQAHGVQVVHGRTAFPRTDGIATTRIQQQRRACGDRRSSSNTALCMGIILYGSQGSRSPLVNWGAYESGVPLEMAEDLSRNPHPFGQIPCLVDEDEGATVFESGAILNYLQTKAETGDSAERVGSIMSWIAWANASLDPICFLETPDGKVYDTGLKRPNRRIDALDTILSTKEFLVEGGFSLADVAVASYLLYVPQFFRDVDLSRWPNVVRYMRRCASRECYGRAYGPAVQQFLVETLDRQLGGGGEGGGEGQKKKLFGMF